MGGLENGVLENVHVDAGRGPRAQHLGIAQQAADPDDMRRQGLFHGKDALLQPVHQGHVVGQAAQEGHGGVGVRVDEARHEEHVRQVDALVGHPFLFHPGDGARGDNKSVAHGQRGVVKKTASGVLCQNPGRMKERVAMLHGKSSFGRVSRHHIRPCAGLQGRGKA